MSTRSLAVFALLFGLTTRASAATLYAGPLAPTDGAILSCLAFNLSEVDVEVTFEVLGALGGTSGPLVQMIPPHQGRETVDDAVVGVTFPRVCKFTFKAPKRKILASACVDLTPPSMEANCIAAVESQ